MNANATTPMPCEESCGLCINLDGKSRTGPSLCYQDYYLAPLYAVCVGVLLARRAKALNEIAPADEPLKYYQRKDFVLVTVAVLHSLYGLMAVVGGDSGEDSTVGIPPPFRAACAPCFFPIMQSPFATAL